MIANFSPLRLDFRDAVNTAGPHIDELADPIPFGAFLAGIRFAPAPGDTVVSTTIDPPDGPFRIHDMIVFDVGFEFVGNGETRTKVRQKVLERASSRQGAGPIPVGKGQVLLVRPAYDAGPKADHVTEKLRVSTKDGDSALVPLSLDTFVPPPVAVVETKVSSNAFSIVAGKSAELQVTVRSVSGPAADVVLQQSPIFLDAKVHMQPVRVHVEP